MNCFVIGWCSVRDAYIAILYLFQLLLVHLQFPVNADKIFTLNCCLRVSK